jgi:hypothetical protein
MTWSGHIRRYDLSSYLYYESYGWDNNGFRKLDSDQVKCSFECNVVSSSLPVVKGCEGSCRCVRYASL